MAKKCGNFIISGHVLHSKKESLRDHAFEKEDDFHERYERERKPIIGLVKDESTIKFMRYNSSGKYTMDISGEPSYGSMNIDKLCELLAGVRPEPSDVDVEFVSALVGPPVLIITNGATGSGKSSLVEKVKHHCKLTQDFEPFLIDDLIETNEEYKRRIDEIIREECDSKVQEVCDDLRKKIQSANPELVTRFNNAYMAVRGKCENSNVECKYCDNNTKTCDDLLDEMLNDAIRDRKSMVFETTGTYYVEWLISKLPKDYRIIYAFTLVEKEENRRRNLERTVSSIESYLKDREKLPAPRLPSVEPSLFSQNLKKIHSNLLTTIGRKLLGDPTLDERLRILVFDNNVSEISEHKCRPIFDSSKFGETMKYYNKAIAEPIRDALYNREQPSYNYRMVQRVI